MKKPSAASIVGHETLTNSLVYRINWLWRIIVPVTALTLFGAALDDKMTSAPWFMLLGALLGLLLSIFLLRQLEQKQTRTDGQ